MHLIDSHEGWSLELSFFGSLARALGLGGGADDEGQLGGVLGNEDHGLLGNHGDTPIDTGGISGILPEVDGYNVLDADLFSGSYGANYGIVAGIGPDGFDPILASTISGGGADPLDLQLLGMPITNLLGSDGGLFGEFAPGLDLLPTGAGASHGDSGAGAANLVETVVDTGASVPNPKFVSFAEPSHEFRIR